MTGWHDWRSWHDYMAIHDSYMDHWSHFIVDDRLSYGPAEQQVYWTGEIICQGGIEIHITKWQEVERQGAQEWVRTRRYSYHVLRRTPGGEINLFRYDNVHVHERHPDRHHRHLYTVTGEQVEPA